MDEQVLEQLRQEHRDRLAAQPRYAGGKGRGRDIDSAIQYILDKVVLENGCWIWQKTLNGYAIFHMENKRFKLSRMIYHITRGNPAGPSMVCHTCDTPACIRPDHFFLGNHKINCADSVAKGRHIHGEIHPNSLLTENQVLEILRDTKPYCHGKSGSDFARKFGVGRNTICDILHRRTWRHVTL